jgi:hypothetical protein
MTRKSEGMTRRLDAGHLKDVEAAATHRMANMLVQDVFTHGAYEVPKPLRHLIVAYSGIATPPRTAEPPGARHTRWYMRKETARGGSAAYYMRGMQRYLTRRARDDSIHEHESSPATHPPNDGNGAAGVGGVVDQRIRDTDYAIATGRERRHHLLRGFHIRRDPEVQYTQSSVLRNVNLRNH